MPGRRDEATPDPLGRGTEDRTIHASAESAHHVVRLGLWWYPQGDEGAALTTVHAEGYLSPDQALSLAANLVVSATSAMRRQAMDLAAGDCGTCNNLRLVVKTNAGGRDEQVGCPDCRAAFNAWATSIPTLPVWAEDEQRLLRP